VGEAVAELRFALNRTAPSDAEGCFFPAREGASGSEAGGFCEGTAFFCAGAEPPNSLQASESHHLGLRCGCGSGGPRRRHEVPHAISKESACSARSFGSEAGGFCEGTAFFCAGAEPADSLRASESHHRGALLRLRQGVPHAIARTTRPTQDDGLAGRPGGIRFSALPLT
jgi:hypothetical protein